MAKDPYFEGSWFGNDTIWRTVLDLNRILFYVNRDGELRDNIQRKFMAIVDGIIAGENEGPLEPTPKPCCIILGGFNPVAVDSATARIMGFDYKKIPIINNAFNPYKYPLGTFSHNDIKICLNNNTTCVPIASLAKNLRFEPSAGWIRHIEL